MDDYDTIPPGPVLGVKTLITNSPGRILILKRSHTNSRPGGWDFAGGLVEFGEDPKDAAVREVKEETSLDLDSLHVIDTFTQNRTLANGHKKYTVIIGFLGRVDTMVVTLSSEHTEYQWLTVAEALSLEWPDVHLQFLQKINSHYSYKFGN